MPRPPEGLASVAAALARALLQPRPAWVSESTWTAAEVLLRRLRRDALRALAGGLAEGAAALGVHRDTVHQWREGWLGEDRP